MAIQLPDDLVIAISRIQERHTAPEHVWRAPAVDRVKVPVNRSCGAVSGPAQVAIPEHIESPFENPIRPRDGICLCGREGAVNRVDAGMPLRGIKDKSWRTGDEALDESPMRLDWAS